MRNTAIKKILEVALIFLIALSIGRALSLNPGASVNAWLHNLFPAMMFATILLLVATGTFSSLWCGWMSGLQQARKPKLTKVVAISIVASLGVLMVVHKPGLVFLLGFTFSFGGVLGACILMMENRRPLGFAVLVMTMPFIHFLEYEYRFVLPLRWGMQLPLFVTPAVLILLLVALIILARRCLDRKAFAPSPFYKVWAVMFILMLVSSCFSSDPHASFQYTIYFFTTSIVPFFIIVNTIQTSEDVKNCIVALGMAGALRIFSLLYQQGAHASLFDYGLTYFAETHYNISASLGGGFIWKVFPIWFFIGGAFCWRLGWQRALSFAFGISMLLLDILRSPRSGVILTAVMAMVFIIPRPNRNNALIGLLMGVFLMMVLWAPLSRHTPLGRWKEFSSMQGSIESQRMRLDGLRSAFLMMRDHPMFGVGPGMWTSAIPDYASFSWGGLIKGTRIYIGSAHNFFLGQGAYMGIPGMVAAVLFAVFMLKESIRLYRKERGGPLEMLAIVFVCYAVGFWTDTMMAGFEFGPTILADGRYVLWLVLGLLAGWLNVQENEERSMVHSSSLVAYRIERAIC